MLSSLIRTEVSITYAYVPIYIGQARLDALCLGPCPFSPASLLHAPASEGELIVTVGEGISLAGAVGEATPAAGGSMLLKMAQGAVQGVLGALAKAPGSAASSWLLGRLRGREGQEPAGPGPSSVAAGLLASLTPDDEELRLALQEVSGANALPASPITHNSSKPQYHQGVSFLAIVGTPTHASFAHCFFSFCALFQCLLEPAQGLLDAVRHGRPSPLHPSHRRGLGAMVPHGRPAR